MTSTATAARTGRPAKPHRDRLRRPRVFGREGYTRASVDTIAAEAGVSKRTIYNHYQDKEQLLLSVLQESTHAVAAHQEELIDQHLTGPADLRTELMVLGRALAAPQSGFEGHFALVRVIFAEAPRLPSEVIESWRTEGPRRTQARLAEHFHHPDGGRPAAHGRPPGRRRPLHPAGHVRGLRAVLPRRPPAAAGRAGRAGRLGGGRLPAVVRKRDLTLLPRGADRHSSMPLRRGAAVGGFHRLPRPVRHFRG